MASGVTGAGAGAGGARSRARARALIALSLLLLLLAGWLGESAAKPPLGPRGWAPGQLPWALGSGAVTATLATAYILGAGGLWLGLRSARPWPVWAIGALALGALLVMPFGSADHTNYAAYGRIAFQGGDPYVESPIAWAGGADPVTSGVQPPWQSTPSIYGPLSTLAQLVSAAIGGDNLRQVVWVWQVLIVLAWLGTRVLLRRLFPDAHGRVDLLWTMNPFVIGTGVLGAHVDTLATPLMVAALLLARGALWPRALAAGVACGLASSVKVTAGVVLVAIAVGWLVEARAAAGAVAARGRGGGLVTRLAALVAGAALVAVPLQVWAGGRSYDQLGRSRRSISLATPWRKVYEWFGGHLDDGTWRSLIFAAAALTCMLLAWAAWRLLRTAVPAAGAAVVLALALSIAYAVGAPYVLPWYDQLVWALLPGVAAGAAVGAVGAVERVWIVRGLMLALAYVPGRVVGMSAGVESLTLGWRRDVAPLAAIVAGVVLLLAGRRGRDRETRRA
ncbi:hypothetical protein GCM10009811_35250 [Nostocoides veronense]|uniref:DUF2029 domain-containing protein n=1 Tax=Nostocoides veronense TaxID=330836 RepID=A0ABN2M507_9MICO